MEITRNVILDLLPLYTADEVSADTRVLVEKYLETDPELANVAKHSAAMRLSGEIPISLTVEDKMRAYMKAKWLISLRTIFYAALIAIVLLAIVVTFLLPS